MSAISERRDTAPQAGFAEFVSCFRPDNHVIKALRART
jgi:hypothetical protein